MVHWYRQCKQGSYFQDVKGTEAMRRYQHRRAEEREREEREREERSLQEKKGEMALTVQ